MKMKIFVVAIVSVAILVQQLFIVTKTYSYKETDKVYDNPMMGFAPSADYIDAVGDSKLVYCEITWAELEPTEGQYDFDTIEQENYFDKWRELGKKVIFRFVCDKPGSKKHMDIPQWLYDKTGDGTFYDNDYGKGYSPDYTNTTLIDYHKKAIQALGKKYSKDSFLCYIELGSVGHWGEWHVNYSAGVKRMPSASVCKKYVKPYVDAFPNTKLLMRRPFSFVSEYGMGVFNDMTGDESETDTWLSWIEKGGTYNQPAKAEKLKAVPKIWNTSPVGGEFTSGINMDALLTSNLKTTVALLQKSHMTFVGPMCPLAHTERIEYKEQTNSVLKNIGYRYTIQQSKVVYNRILRQTKVRVKIKNIGVAPMYYDWPVYIGILTDSGEIVNAVKTEMELTKLTQNKSDWAEAVLSGDYSSEGNGRVVIYIADPDTKKAAVRMAVDMTEQDMVYMLY